MALAVGTPYAPAVAAFGIHQQRGRHAGGLKRGVVAQGILRMHHVVIAAVDYECPGRRGRDFVLGRVFGSQVIGAVLAYEALTRTFVRDGFVERCHGVEQQLESRVALRCGVGGYGRCQVAAGRRTHDSDLLRVYAPCGGAVGQNLECPAHIVHRYFAVAFWHAVLKHGECHALAVEERHPVITLVAGSQEVISAARTAYYGLAVCKFSRRQENFHFRVVEADGARRRHFGACGSEERGAAENHCKQSFHSTVVGLHHKVSDNIFEKKSQTLLKKNSRYAS